MGIYRKDKQNILTVNLESWPCLMPSVLNLLRARNIYMYATI